MLLDKAMNRLIGRHEVLRTRFERLPGMEVPVQVIGSNGHSNVSLVEASNGEVEQREGGLEKALLVRRGVEQHELRLSISALCADLWSVENIVRELAELYESNAQLNEVIQYADFAEWQNRLIESEDKQDERQYWLDQKEKLPAPVVLPLESGAGSRSRRVLSWEIDAAKMERVRSLAGAENSSVEAVLLACWQALLWRLSEQPDILVEVSFDGRKFEYLQPALGLFSKYLPISSHFENSFHIGDILRQLSGALSSAQKRQAPQPARSVLRSSSSTAWSARSCRRWSAPSRSRSSRR